MGAQKVVRAEQAFGLPGVIAKGYHQLFAAREAIAVGDNVEVGYFVRIKDNGKEGTEVEGAKTLNSTQPVLGVVVLDHYVNSNDLTFKYKNGDQILVQLKGYQYLMVDKKANTNNTTPKTGMKIFISETDGKMKFSTSASEGGFTDTGWVVSKGVSTDITNDGETIIEISNL